jgi:ribosomal protein L16/L10AE
MLFVHYKDVITAHAQEALRQAKFKFLGHQKIIVGRNGENPHIHSSSPF